MPLFSSVGTVVSPRHRSLVKDEEEGEYREEELVAWGDRFGPLFSDEQVALAANLVDPSSGKRTNLKEKDSLWTALQSIMPPDSELPPPRNRGKFPLHVLAGASDWNCALSNAYVFSQESSEYRHREGERFKNACKSVKDRMGRHVSSLMKRRPDPPLGASRPLLRLGARRLRRGGRGELPPRAGRVVDERSIEELVQMQAARSLERRDALRGTVGYDEGQEEKLRASREARERSLEAAKERSALLAAESVVHRRKIITAPPGKLHLTIAFRENWSSGRRGLGSAAVVKEVLPDCPFRGRIRVGDIIRRIDGRTVSSPDDLAQGSDQKRKLVVLSDRKKLGRRSGTKKRKRSTRGGGGEETEGSDGGGPSDDNDDGDSTDEEEEKMRAEGGNPRFDIEDSTSADQLRRHARYLEDIIRPMNDDLRRIQDRMEYLSSRCSVEGCSNKKTRPEDPEGVCYKHGGKKRKKRPACEVEGCTCVALHQGRCMRHLAEDKPDWYFCSVEGCQNKKQRAGLCTRHGAPLPKCRVEGCSRNIKMRGLCGRHLRQAEGLLDLPTT